MAEAKRLATIDVKAKTLLNLINNCITTGKYAVATSANYVKDKLYGDEKLIAESDVIDKAANMWVIEDGRCLSEFKNEKDFRLRNETNFMKLIVPGQPDNGKHNVHVIHVNAGSKIIKTPLFETTIERKLRLGQRIDSNWYHVGDMVDGKVPHAPPKS